MHAKLSTELLSADAIGCHWLLAQLKRLKARLALCMLQAEFMPLPKHSGKQRGGPKQPSTPKAHTCSQWVGCGPTSRAAR